MAEINRRRSTAPSMVTILLLHNNVREGREILDRPLPATVDGHRYSVLMVRRTQREDKEWKKRKVALFVSHVESLINLN